MGFRNEEEARFHRIQALETELEERDRKIAALEEKLEGKRKPKKESKAKAGEGATSALAAKVPKVAGVPGGQRWKVPVHRSHLWRMGLGILAITGWMAGFVLFLADRLGSEFVRVMVMLMVGNVAGALYALHRHYLILDKEAGTVTRLNEILLAKWRRVESYRGQSIRVERVRWSTGDGKTPWKYYVFLGEMKLFTMRAEYAVSLAQRIAAFLEVPYQLVTLKGAKATRIERRHELMIWGPILLAIAVYFLWIFPQR